MNKILEINEEVISIGLSNGSLIEVRRDDLNFEPRIGDTVDVFQNESKTTVVLADQSSKTSSNLNNQEGNGVNIHINNDHSNTAAANAPTYVASGKVVSKVIYVVLAMLLGGIGAHKFYSGKIVLGIIYLVFVWTYIPAIIGFVEGVIALTKQADGNGNIII